MRASARNVAATRAAVCLITLFVLLSVDFTYARAAEADSERVSVSAHYRGERGSARALFERRDEHEALDSASVRKPASRTLLKPGGEAGLQTVNSDFWFYDADVELFRDQDRDGYYAGIDLLFDIDTWYVAADVYAVAFLSFDGGPWNEYAATDDFVIAGATSDDDYIIVTDLVSGYPRGSYDLLIEVYDALDGSLLAWFGPEDSSELSFLPLEDTRRDEPDRGTIVVSDGGGSFGFLSCLVLTSLVLAGRARRRFGPA